MAAIDIRAIDDDVYADVTKRFCEAHVPHSSHVSKAAHDVTAMHRSIITNLVHIKALRFFIRWTEPSAASALQPLLSNFKQNKSEEEGKKALKTASEGSVGTSQNRILSVQLTQPNFTEPIHGPSVKA